MKVQPSDLPLERAFKWEKERANQVYMVQPFGGAAVKEYTWAQTVDQARRMATYLRAQNFPAGSNIAILAKNSAHFIMADLAIWMAGHASVAIYPTLNAETVNYILTHSESKLMFMGKLDTWKDMKPGVPTDMPIVAFPLAPQNDYKQWDDIVAQTEPLPGQPVRKPEDISIIVYTSGSTGRPKGVVHNFAALGAAALGFSEILKVKSDERQISYLPLAHVFERAAVEVASLYNGTKVFFAESLETFVNDVQRARPTLFHSVPRLWLKFNMGVLKKMPEEKLNKLLRIPILNRIVKKKILTGLGLDQARMAVSGSAPIPPELISWYRNLGLELLEGYGMTENFAYSHFSLPGKTRVGYVGNAVPDVEHRISEAGEILVKSPANMLGYYKMPEESKDSFTEDGFLKTGDRGELDEQGRLRITGRVKELFKTSKGKYVAPAPIENLFNASSFIEQTCVAGSGYEACHAVVMLSEDWRARKNDPDAKTKIEEGLTKLLHEVNKQVEPHERLQFVAIAKDDWLIENGFLTPTMKIKRNILEGTYGPKLDQWYNAKQKVIWEA